MDIGIRWAIDGDPDATAVFKANFSSAVVENGLIEHHLGRQGHGGYVAARRG